MKLSQQQLRRIIRETAKRKLEEAEGTIDIPGEVAEFLSSALVMWLDEDGLDLIGSNAWEQMIGTVGEEGMPVPGRVEDVEHFAQQAAERVLSNPDLKERLTKIATNMLESAMDNFGAPGPGGH